MGRGNPLSSIMLVGEAPGESEARTGKPFMGLAGQLLDELIEEADLLDRVYITNTCKCRPPENRRPTEAEGVICSEAYLSKELELLKPKIVVALGVVAARCFFPGTTVVRGDVQYSRKFRCNVICSWHPSYARRFASRVARQQLLEALQKAKEQV
jgi:uracil-DNA glycosylase family 4